MAAKLTRLTHRIEIQLHIVKLYTLLILVLIYATRVQHNTDKQKETKI